MRIKLNLLLLAVAISGIIQAQTSLGKYTFNGEVLAIEKASDGGTYVGGKFTAVGLYCGNGIILDDSTGAWNDNEVKVEGEITCVIAIPSGFGGGWYIGGNFTRIDGQERNYLARINDDGTLHAFNPDMNDKVRSLAIDSSGALYAGGHFTMVGGSTYRNGIAKFDSFGVLTNFNPSLFPISSSNHGVLAISIDVTGNLYIGGGFTSVGGISRTRFAKFDSSGALASFNPSFDSNVLAMAIDTNGNLYVGGTFTLVNGITRNRLAKFDSTGVLTGFDPNLNSTVYALKLDEGANLNVGGNFTSVDGITRNRFAKFNSAGALTSFNPNLNSTVYAIELDSSGNLFIGGLFTSVGGISRGRLAKFDSTGVLNSFNPNMTYSVDALALDANGKLYTGGYFTAIGGWSFRNRLAKFDAAGVLSSFDPNFNNDVYALALDANGDLYVGGRFTYVAGISRWKLAKLDSTGALDSFNPDLNHDVLALAIDSSGNLYAGGSFTFLAGAVIRTHLAKFDSSGMLTGFAPNITGTVRTLILDANGNVYVGGNFSTINGISRTRVAKFDSTGALTSFNPNIDIWVSALAIDAIGNLYVGGSFLTVNGISQRGLVKFSASGLLSSFNADLNGNVNALELDANGSLYVGGDFTSIGGSTIRNRLAKFDSNGVLLNFNPNYNNKVNTIAVDAVGYVHVGGTFSKTYDYYCNGPSVISTTPGSNCGPGIVVLEAQAASGATVNWYTDSIGGSPLFTGTIFTTPFISASTTYYVEVDNGICVSDYRIPVIASINTFFPNAPFGLANQSFCDSATVADLFAVGVGIKWYDAAIGGNLLSETDALVNATDYFASQTVNGCEGTSRLQVSVSITAVDESITNSSPTLTSNANGATYQWIDCNNGFAPIFGETNQSFTASANGNYAVVVSQNGCTDTSSCVLVNNVGIEESQANAYDLSIFPNPSDGLFVIEYDYTAPVQIEVMTTDGKLILIQELTEKSNLLDLSHLPKGIYYLHLTFGNSQKTTRRVILQ